MKIKETDWELEVMYRGRPLSDYRAAIIEECAKVADDYLQDYGPVGLVDAIRALKEKPNGPG